MKYLVWLSISLFISVQLSGQWQPSPAELFEEAEEYFLFEEYNEALPLYMRINLADSLPAFIRYRVGICYLNMPGEEYRALPFLEFAAENVSPELIKGSLTETKAPADALFFLGIAYRHINETGKAQTALKRFIEITENPTWIERAERELDNTYTAELFRKNARQIEKTEVAAAMGLTGEEYNLVISGDESTLAYAGSLKFYDAVFYSKLENQIWSQAKNITPQLGSDGDAYPLSLSYDGKKMLIYRYDPGTNGDIYISRFEGDSWTKMELLSNPINSEYYESHASFSFDENSIYFSSNRPGGFGGQDIYLSAKDETGIWGPPVNLGPQINTPGDETGPFISKDGKHLFFSSTGHTNMGGFDVFHSELLENGIWAEAYNLGYPINNSADNQFFIPVEDGTEAFYEMMTAQQYKEFVKVGNFLNRLHPIVNVAVHVSEAYPGLSSTQPEFTLTDIRNGSILKTFEGIPQNGRFDLQLGPGYYELKLQNERYQPVASEFSIARYYPEPDMVVSLELNPVPVEIELHHLYFAFDDYKLSEKEQQKLESLLTLLNDYSNLDLELRGFTDISGDRNYNKLLAGKRAGMVAEYLVSKGISLDRMKIISLGPENFIATNAVIEGRRLNRRVEIHIKDLPGFVQMNFVDEIPEHLRFKKE